MGGAYRHVDPAAGRRPRGGVHTSGAFRKRSEGPGENKRILLADAVMRALAARRYADAMTAILNLVELEPAEPRWHQKYGEVLRTLGRNREAAAAYRRAARRYEAGGFAARASAVLRVAEELEAEGARSQRPRGEETLSQRVLRGRERITSRPPGS